MCTKFLPSNDEAKSAFDLKYILFDTFQFHCLSHFPKVIATKNSRYCIFHLHFIRHFLLLALILEYLPQRPP